MLFQVGKKAAEVDRSRLSLYHYLRLLRFFSVARAGKSGHFADTLSSGLIQNLAIEAEFLHHFFVSSFWPKSFRREKPDFLAARLLRE